jgi:hypothetical protein
LARPSVTEALEAIRQPDRRRVAATILRYDHGFRRGLATNLERIAVRGDYSDDLGHANDRVTREHFIEPPTLEARGNAAIVLELFGNRNTGFAPRLLPGWPERSPENNAT